MRFGVIDSAALVQCLKQQNYQGSDTMRDRSRAAVLMFRNKLAMERAQGATLYILSRPPNCGERVTLRRVGDSYALSAFSAVGAVASVGEVLASSESELKLIQYAHANGAVFEGETYHG